MSLLDQEGERVRRERAKAHAERNGQANRTTGVLDSKEPHDSGARVVLGTDEHRVTAEAEAILAAKARNLYQRGRQLVQVLQYAPDPDPARERKRRIRRSGGAPVVRALPAPILRDELSRHVQFVKRSDEGDIPAHVPGYAVSTIAARGEWRNLRCLEGVVSHPVLLPDGSILATPGYGADSGLLLWMPKGLEVTIPEAPTRADAAIARRALLDVVGDFPLQDGRSQVRLARLAAHPAGPPRFRGHGTAGPRARPRCSAPRG